MSNKDIHRIKSILSTDLAESTIDALRHVDVVACGPSRAVFTFLGFYGDRLQFTKKMGKYKVTTDIVLLSKAS